MMHFVHASIQGTDARNGFCCRKTGPCAPTEISIGNTCYPISTIGGSCVNSAQCQSLGAYCSNGVCVPNIQYDNPICTRPNQQVERESGMVKNCLYQPCSVGFGCEYSNAMRQYICCGRYDANNDYSYGKVRMYPGTTMPLQCFKADQCLWVDTPNCVYSSRYRQKVCCSTFNC
ncbi:EB module [Cooperia oncophora]